MMQNIKTLNRKYKKHHIERQNIENKIFKYKYRNKNKCRTENIEVEKCRAQDME